MYVYVIVINDGVTLEFNGVYHGQCWDVLGSAILPVALMAILVAAILGLQASTELCVAWEPVMMDAGGRTALPTTIEPVIRSTALLVSYETGTLPNTEEVA